MAPPASGSGFDFRPDPSGAAEGVHRPVLLAEVLAAVARVLGERPEGRFVDGTVGAGGHARALLERFPDLELFASDQDPDSLGLARERLAPFAERVHLHQARLSELDGWLAAAGEPAPVGLLVDLGVCSLHLDRADRGFSFQADGPLDMRMDPRLESTAADIVARWSEAELADLFFQQGGERRARRVAAALVEARRRAPFLRTGALADLVERVLGPGGRVHAATRVFQALRIAVNREDQELEQLLATAERRLAPGGLLLAISFHSGEDGRIKRFLAAGARAGTWLPEAGSPEEPSRAEVRANPRARSARLRVARRTETPPRADLGPAGAREERP